MDFTIDPSYLTSVPYQHEYNLFEGKTDLTHKELLAMMQNRHLLIISSTKDHPEFEKLRTSLGEMGFISINRQWANGDIVLKPFTLNDKKFEPGDRFFCAAALKHRLEN